MKNFTIIHILLFILLMLAYQCTRAQDLVVTSKGDTIVGDVKPITYGVEKKVQVTASDRKKSILSIFQTKAYVLKGETYHPVKHDGGYTFMKLVKPGYLSLYAFQLPNQVAFDGLYLVKRGGTGMEVPNLSFKKYMSRFLQDCPDVASRIDEGDLSKKNLDKIVDEYNQCIESNTVDHEKVITENRESTKKISAWDVLEDKVKNKSDFEGKSDALEMISDIKNKISRGEKIPNFLIEGLKTSLSETDLDADLQNAVRESGGN
jgi:hypothetical protein